MVDRVLRGLLLELPSHAQHHVYLLEAGSLHTLVAELAP